MTQPHKGSARKARWLRLFLGLLALALIGLCGRFVWTYSKDFSELSMGPREIAVQTWIDDNRNGIWDEDEPPLAYVEVNMVDAVGGTPAWGITDEDGALVFGGLRWPESREEMFEFYPVAPPGYELLGSERVRAHPAEIEETRISFGFALLPGRPMPTPRPAVVLDCQPIYESNRENNYVGVAAIQPGLEGSVVLTLDNEAGVRRYTSDGTFRDSLPAAPNVPTDRVRVGTDGPIWAWGGQVPDGLAVFDGTDWQTVAPYDHPGDYRVRDAAIAPDGAVWLGTELGALRRDAATGEWTRHASFQPISAVVPTPDGTVWLLKCDWLSQCEQKLIRLTPGGPRLYEESQVATLGEPLGNVLGAAYDGSGVWVVNSFGLARWDIAAANWTFYTPETTNYAFPPDAITAYDQAPDGTLWLAKAEDGLIRARPQSGEWHFANSPLLDGQYLDGVVVAGDGSVWVSLESESSVYRCE